MKPVVSYAAIDLDCQGFAMMCCPLSFALSVHIYVSLMHVTD